MSSSSRVDSLSEEIMETFFKSRYRDEEREAMISEVNNESIKSLSSQYVPVFINNVPLLQSEIIDVDHVSPVFRERTDIEFNQLIPLYVEAVSTLVNIVGENNETHVEILRADVIGVSDNILLKVPGSDDGKSELKVEHAIGFYALNRLRDEIPNFMQTYGIFSCGEPVHNRGGRSGICDPSENSANYLVIENIQESETAGEFVSNKSFRVVCSLFLQVYLALLVARDRVKFAHYDLHSDNVLINEYEKVININYRYEGKNLMVATPYIATIIDFGRSMVTVDGNVISGSYLMSDPIGPYPEPRIELDMYRFFMSCVSNAPEKRKYQKLYELFGGTGPIITALEEQVNCYYQYPGRELDIDAIIHYLQANCKDYKYVPGNVWKPNKYRRRRIEPPITTLEYFESLPEGKDAEIDEELILNESQDDLLARYDAIGEMEDTIEKYYESRKYVTLAKLHITFVENRGITEDGFCKYLRNVIRASHIGDMENIRLLNRRNRSGVDYSNYANRSRYISIGHKKSKQ